MKINVSVMKSSSEYKVWFQNFDNYHYSLWSNVVLNMVDPSPNQFDDWLNFCNQILPPGIRLISWTDEFDNEFGTLQCESEEDLTAFILKWS